MWAVIGWMTLAIKWIIQLTITAIKLFAKVLLTCLSFIVSAVNELKELSWKKEEDKPKVIKNLAIVIVSALVAILLIWFVIALLSGDLGSSKVYQTSETKKVNTTMQTTTPRPIETTKAPVILKETTIIMPETTIFSINEETTIIVPQTTIETIVPQTSTILETTKIVEQSIPQETTINIEHINDNFYITEKLDTYSETFDIEDDYSSKATIVIPKIEGKDAIKVARANEFMNSAKDDIVGEFENILSEVSPAYKSLNIIKNEVSAQSSNRLKITMSGILKTNNGTNKNIKYIFNYDVDNDDYDIERKE